MPLSLECFAVHQIVRILSDWHLAERTSVRFEAQSSLHRDSVQNRHADAPFYANFSFVVVFVPCAFLKIYFFCSFLVCVDRIHYLAPCKRFWIEIRTMWPHCCRCWYSRDLPTSILFLPVVCLHGPPTLERAWAVSEETSSSTSV